MKKRKTLKRATKNSFTVYIAEQYAVIGALDVLILGLFIVFSPILWPNENIKSMAIFYIVFGVGVLLGVYIMIKSLRFRIVVKNENLTVYPLLSKSYTFTFDDIETVKRQVKKRYEGQAERIVIRTNQGRKVIAESLFVAYRKLIEKIHENVDESKLIGEWENE